MSGEIPGLGDPASTAKKYLKAEGKKYVELAKQEALVLVVTAIAKFLSNNPPPVDEIINTLNPIIDNLNIMIGWIDDAITKLKDFVETIFPIIGILTAVYIAFKIISLVPAPVVAWGAGVGYTTFISTCAAMKTKCEILLSKLATIAYAVLAVILMLLNVFSFIGMLVGIISNFLSTMVGLLNSLITNSLKTADDWAETFKVDDGRSNLDRNKLGDTFENLEERLNLMSLINNLKYQCLSSGVCKDDELENLQNKLDSVGGHLPSGNQIITSLLNLNNDITVEKATHRKGKRYGFYQSEYGNDKSSTRLRVPPPPYEPLDKGDTGFTEDMPEITENLDYNRDDTMDVSDVVGWHQAGFADRGERAANTILSESLSVKQTVK